MGGALEVDAARYARHIAHVQNIAHYLSLYHSNKGFGYGLWVDTSSRRKAEALEAMRL